MSDPSATDVSRADIAGPDGMEATQRSSEDRDRSYFERDQAGVYRSTPDGRMVDCNESFARILGYASAAEALAQPATAFYADPQARQRLLSLVRASGKVKNFELKARRKDGSEGWVLLTVGLRGGASAGAEVLEGTLIDISELKETEAALRRSEQQYRDIFDLATVGIFQSRGDGTFLTVNARLADILGYPSPRELLSVSLEHVYANPADLERVIGGKVADDVTRQTEVAWTRKDGTPVWVEVNARALRDENGQTRYVQGFVHDVTERRQSEEERRALAHQLSQSQKIEAVGQLAGGIAHDFNNLLTAIRGYTELLIASLPVEDPRRQHGEQIRRCAERATSLTRQLLAFSRRQVLEPKTLDLNQIVSGLEDMLRRSIGEHIQLRVRGAPDLWPVKADPGQLEQAILNLVVNARDAMPQGGQLTIETANAELDPTYAGSHAPAVPGQYAMVAVTDSGVGMDAQVRARLFEPFFTTKEQGKGTGLGLSTTYGIVKQSGGYIWCYSEPGRGSSFKIYLPRTAEDRPAEAPAVSSAPTAPSEHPHDETILLVEDEPEVRALVLKLLKMQGYTVVAAANPDEALAITRDFQGVIDLMVTDVVMPGMSGRQLADRLASSRPDMRVLFVSGYTDDAIVHHGILDPGTAFLQKPFTPQALARKVREVIEAPPGQFKVS